MCTYGLIMTVDRPACLPLGVLAHFREPVSSVCPIRVLWIRHGTPIRAIGRSKQHAWSGWSINAYFGSVPAVGKYCLSKPFEVTDFRKKTTQAMGQYYEIVSIRQTEPPPDGKGSNWYRYVIAFEGSNSIHGCRQGGLKAVTRAVEEIVAQLNERQHLRHVSKASRVDLVLKKKTHK